MLCGVSCNTELGVFDLHIDPVFRAVGSSERMDGLRIGETDSNNCGTVKKKYLTIEEASCILRKDVKMYALTEEVCDGIVGTDTAL